MDIPTLNIRSIFSDLDYTLLDFDVAHQAGILKVADQFGQEFAQDFSNVFMLVLEGVRAQKSDWSTVLGGQEAFENLLLDFKMIEGVSQPHLWSRELYASVVYEQLKQTYTLDMARLVADTYWGAVASEGILYRDAIRFLVNAQQRGISVHLFTGSDSRLRAQNSSWSYDPAFSMMKKLGRIAGILKPDFEFSSITIGDPDDKPSRQFYELMLLNAERELQQSVDLSQAIVIGDSYENDIEAPMSRIPFVAGFLINRSISISEQIAPNVWKIPSLDCIPLG